MLSNRTLIKLLEPATVLKLIFLLLLISLVPIGETLLIMYLGGRIGRFLTLAVAASTAALGLLFGVPRIRRIIFAIKEEVRQGDYPGEGFAEFAGALFATILLILPGFVTDFFGLIFLLPLLRRAVGRGISGPMKPRLKELYEYLKLNQG